MIDAEDEPVMGSIIIEVEAAPQGIMRVTLDADGPRRAWWTALLAHDDAVMGAAPSPEQMANLLVRGSIDCIRLSVPSLVVGGLTMRLEPGPNGNAQIVSSGPARFRRAEWDAAVHAQGCED
ncbi:hypothetical protein SRABI76_01522 [Microbacterium oxydans]|uniref:Uncharacterized protein n=1 Tax=Microbacterium oxydans TaxID=82380 RepID=A0A0F0L535_9MICO|nr:hypothetical protein [Microbacterium oxydans]KJL27794.1 hypothetical protein RS83_02848 [Microbacterium oxydans]CAH0180628.1 hypothetical protein SRABI76_01522 [Microbacterium oxydans]